MKRGSMQLPRIPFMTALFDPTSWPTKYISPDCYCQTQFHITVWISSPLPSNLCIYALFMWKTVMAYWEGSVIKILICCFCFVFLVAHCITGNVFKKLFDLYSAYVFILAYVAKCLPSTDCEWVGKSVIKRTILRLTMYIKWFALTLLYKDMHIERNVHLYVCLLFYLCSLTKKFSLQFQSRISLMFFLDIGILFYWWFLFLYTVVSLFICYRDKYKIKLYLGWCFVIQSKKECFLSLSVYPSIYTYHNAV